MEGHEDEQQEQSMSSQQVNESQNFNDEMGANEGMERSQQQRGTEGEQDYEGREGQEYEEGDGEEREYMDEEGYDNDGIEYEGEQEEGEQEEGEQEEEEGEEGEEQSGSQSQIQHTGQQNESELNEDGSNEQMDGEDDNLDSQNEDEDEDNTKEVDATLLPERKVRYKLFKFLNRMRQSYRIGELYQDRIANSMAMEYAKYLLNNKESEDELNNLARAFSFTKDMKNYSDFKVSSFEAFVDSDKATKTQSLKYTDYINDFNDVHATLIEFDEHRDNILSPEFNSIGIGLAYNEMKVVVVDLFAHRPVIIDSCNINEKTGTITVKGKINNDTHGAYALRIVKCDEPTKELIKVTPQNIVPFHRDSKTREFTATFNDGSKILGDLDPKMIEVYIRVKPESIPYGKAFTSKISYEQLDFGTRVPLENFPNDKQIQEQKHQDRIDDRREQQEKNNLLEIEKAKKEEKNRRMKLDPDIYGKADDNVIKEEDDDDESFGEKNEVLSSQDKGDKLKRSDSDDDDVQDAPPEEHLEQQMNDLKSNIARYKEENERIQKRIKIIYMIKKEDGREERNFTKESNINESTYADSLASTAGLYNDLNTHKSKLEQDLNRYQESIKDQEKRKEDVYTILMEYKTGLLESAETRKGATLSRQQVDIWLNKEKNLENDIKELRIESFTKSLEMNRLKKELKKMEDYFEGLHIIDFEQLKIENNTLTEKIEDRNEEIHKLKNKINYTVQILAHLQEKYKDISSENDAKKDECDSMKTKIYEMKRGLTKNKELNDHKTLKQLNENKKIDQINSVPLKNYYKNTLKKIEDLGKEIESVSNQLIVYRRKGTGQVKDINELLKRKEKMMQEYKRLPHIESDDKSK